jgi:hypothetical protein
MNISDGAVFVRKGENRSKIVLFRHSPRRRVGRNKDICDESGGAYLKRGMSEPVPNVLCSFGAVQRCAPLAFESTLSLETAQV